MCCRTSFGRRFLLTFSVLALAFVALGLPPQLVFASGGVDDPSLVFQLEGNVITDASICFELTINGAFTAPPSGTTCPSGFTLVSFGATTDDWDVIATPPNHALASSFVGSSVEAINSTGDTIFTGGGAKDILGISSGAWAWKNGKPQGKDDIEHAFAAAYTLPNVVNGTSGIPCGGANQPACDTAVYFGMTRFDNSGNSTGGFWFFQDSSVGLSGGSGTPPTCGKGSGCAFSGHHTNGDLLIVSDFTTGGVVSEIKVFTWSCSGSGAACDSSGALQLREDLTSNATCNPITGSSPFCSIVNATAGLSVPFGFTNKSGQSTLDHGELLEGGIDLQAIFGSNVPCFTTFMAETRSSSSPTATLSDLTPPVSFPLCGMTIDKKCNGGQVRPDGLHVDYSWTVTVKNTGIGPLFDVTVQDTLPDGTPLSIPVICPTPGNPASCTASSLGANASATATVNFTAVCTSAGTCNVPNPLSVVNTANATANTQEGDGTQITPKNGPVQSTCSTQVSGVIQVTKHCDPAQGGPILLAGETAGRVVVKVPFTGQVCNTTTPGNGEAVNNITLSDSPAASSLSPTTILSLSPGQCVPASGSYFPATISSGDGIVLGRYFFTDTLTASGGTGALDKQPVAAASDTKSCPICPQGECNGPLP